MNTNNKSKKRLYRIYYDMKTRCYNSKRKYWNCYGGRGIKICNEWLKSFDNFYNWAIKNGYNDNLTIDRIDVDGNYEPNNCRWITMQGQLRNRTDNVYFIVNNKKKCLAELCEEYNMPYQTVRKRIARGKDILEALTQPIKKEYRNKLYKGKE